MRSKNRKNIQNKSLYIRPKKYFVIFQWDINKTCITKNIYDPQKRKKQTAKHV